MGPHFPTISSSAMPERIQGLLPIMEVDSWLTGRRGISLPFTDECEPLCTHPAACPGLFEEVMRHAEARDWKYMECRGGSACGLAQRLRPVTTATDLDLSITRMSCSRTSIAVKNAVRGICNPMAMRISAKPVSVTHVSALPNCGGTIRTRSGRRFPQCAEAVSRNMTPRAARRESCQSAKYGTANPRSRKTTNDTASTITGTIRTSPPYRLDFSRPSHGDLACSH